MKTKILFLFAFIFSLGFSQGTPRAGGINNSQATVLPAVHDNFTGVQSTNNNAFAVYDFATNFNYQLGLKTTDNVAEGTTNKYFSNALARNAFSAGFGLVYSSGVYGLDSSTQGILASVSGKFNNPTGTALQYIRGDGSLANFPSIPPGTVTSVGITGSDFSISNSPITISGNIGLSLANTGISAGTYGRLTVNAKGLATAGKRQEPYNGVTDASGNYTVTFSTAYSSIPNIQVCLVNPNVRDTPIPTVTATGFTINVQRRTDLIGLLPTYANVVGGSVHVLITEN